MFETKRENDVIFFWTTVPTTVKIWKSIGCGGGGHRTKSARRFGEKLVDPVRVSHVRTSCQKKIVSLRSTHTHTHKSGDIPSVSVVLYAVDFLGVLCARGMVALVGSRSLFRAVGFFSRRSRCKESA
jgi:hypothetical protein